MRPPPPGKAAALIVDSSAVSRYHAQIMRMGDEFFIEDLGSRNGTFVNERPVAGTTRLSNMDNIRICDVVYCYVDGRSVPAGSATKTPGMTTASVVFSGASPLSSSWILGPPLTVTAVPNPDPSCRS